MKILPTLVLSLAVLVGMGPSAQAWVESIRTSFEEVFSQLGGVEEPRLPEGYLDTKVQSDLAILGDGYFLVRAPFEPNLYRLTRAGDFRVDEGGYFVTDYGDRLQGFDARGGEVCDLQIHSVGGSPSDWMRSWRLETDGRLWITMTSGLEGHVASLGLWIPKDPSQVVRLSEQDYSDADLETGNLERFRKVDAGTSQILSGVYEETPPGIRVTRVDPENRGVGRSTRIAVGLETALALEGPGYFQVRDPVSGQRFATRCGLLKWDENGWLVTYLRGYRVQGITLNWGETLRDVRIEQAPPPGSHVSPGAVVVSVAFSRSGVLRSQWSDGTQTSSFILRLIALRRPERLVDAGDAFYRIEDVGEPWYPSWPAIKGRNPTRVFAGELDTRYLSARVREGVARLWSFNQQAITRTGEGTDLGISGKGFFMVRNPDTDELLLTRWGHFHWSADRKLETLEGWRVQGVTDSDTNRLADVTQGGDPEFGGPSAHSFARDGRLIQAFADGATREVCRVVLANIPDPTVLEKLGSYFYRMPRLAGVLRAPSWAQPAERTMGSIQPGALELVNFPYGTPPPVIDRPVVHIELFGIDRRYGRIEVSDDLVHWRVWSAFSHGDYFNPDARGWNLEPGTEIYGGSAFDFSAAALKGRFYRLVAGPRIPAYPY